MKTPFLSPVFAGIGLLILYFSVQKVSAQDCHIYGGGGGFHGEFDFYDHGHHHYFHFNRFHSDHRRDCYRDYEHYSFRRDSYCAPVRRSPLQFFFSYERSQPVYRHREIEPRVRENTVRPQPEARPDIAPFNPPLPDPAPRQSRGKIDLNSDNPYRFDPRTLENNDGKNPVPNLYPPQPPTRSGDFPLDLKLLNSDGKTTSVAEAMGDNQAILIDFWASWCGPCMQLMPELNKRAEELAPAGIAVAGMNVEGDVATAHRIQKKYGLNKLVWLIEPKSEPFSKKYRINSIPRMLLIDRNGEVLFQGHPSDRKLEAALKKLKSNPRSKAPTTKSTLAEATTYWGGNHP